MQSPKWLVERVYVVMIDDKAKLFENVHVFVDYSGGWLTLEKENFEPVAVFAPGTWLRLDTTYKSDEAKERGRLSMDCSEWNRDEEG